MNARAAAPDRRAGLKPGKTAQRRPMTPSRRFSVPTLRREATGAAQTPLAEGAAARAVVRTERVRIVDGPGANRLQMQLDASLYLGSGWEYRLSRSDLGLMMKTANQS